MTDLDKLIRGCVGYSAETMVVAPQYIGLPESELPSLSDTEIRVLARDGRCLDRFDDLLRGRINLIVADGIVVWAAIE